MNRSEKLDSDKYACIAAAWLQRLWAFFALALLAATWRLWTPQTAFPQAPLLRAGLSFPAVMDWLAFAGLILGAAAAGALPLASRWSRAGGLLFAASAWLSFIIDQHRLQPWAWQISLLAIVLASCDARRAVRLARTLTISIYLFSALTKLDFTFVTGLGQHLLSGLTKQIGLSMSDWPLEARIAAALSLPLGELTVGAMLLKRSLWRLGVALSIAMHLTLALAIGPWGLGHKPGVLIWNLFFVAQNLVLFSTLPNREWDAHGNVSATSSWASRIAQAVVVAAIIAPVLEPLGLLDHWLGWALYAPHASRVDVSVHEVAVNRLPKSVRPYLDPPQPGTPWQRLRLDRWSLEALDAPIYPQARFQMAAAVALAEHCQAGPWIRATVRSSASRLRGHRTERTLYGADEIAQAAHRYQVNAQPNIARFNP